MIKEELRELVKSYRGKRTAKSVAEETGVSTSTIWRVWNEDKRGWKEDRKDPFYPREGATTSDDVKRAIYDLHEKGYSQRRIAEELGISRMRVWYWHMRFGWVKQQFRLTPEEKEEICGYYGKKSSKWVAEWMGCEACTVNRVWRDKFGRQHENRPVDDAEREKIIRLGASGMSYKDVAKATNRAYPTVYKIIKANGEKLQNIV